MNIEVADTIVATMVETTATRKMEGSKAEPDPVPVPLLNVEDMKMATVEKSTAESKTRPLGDRPALPA